MCCWLPWSVTGAPLSADFSMTHFTASPEFWAHSSTSARFARCWLSAISCETRFATSAGSLVARSMPLPELPWLMAWFSFCRSATLAPASSAESAAGTPEAPAPTTTTSKSFVSLMSVMGSGFTRKLGNPSRRCPAAVPASPAAAPLSLVPVPLVCGAHEASAPAPTTPAAATVPNLNRSRRLIPCASVRSIRLVMESSLVSVLSLKANLSAAASLCLSSIGVETRMICIILRYNPIIDQAKRNPGAMRRERAALRGVFVRVQ